MAGITEGSDATASVSMVIDDTERVPSPAKAPRIQDDCIQSMDSLDGSTSLRHRTFSRSLSRRDVDEMNYAQDMDFVVMDKPENELEAHRMVANYLVSLITL